MRKTLLFLAVSVGIYLAIQYVPLSSFRGFMEGYFVAPVRIKLFKIKKNDTNKQYLHRIEQLKREVKQLTIENKLLRGQLGTIPEKSSLHPAYVIWETPSELIARFPYRVSSQLSKKLEGAHIIVADRYIGMVTRVGEHLLVVRKATHSTFSSGGVSSRGVKGTLKGQFDERIIFEVEQKEKLGKGDDIYVVDVHNGWRFLVGKVKTIETNSRLPTKTAIVDYIVDKYTPEIFFVVL